MQLEMREVASLRPYKRNARTHSKKQIRQIADSIQKFGFTNPVLTTEDGEIVAGHGRVQAARLLGMESVPVVRLSHLGPEERRAYVLADNKLALNAGWDPDLLAGELQDLIDLGIEIEVTGFAMSEIDLILDGFEDRQPGSRKDRDDQVPDVAGPAVTRPGDIWVMGRHRLLCGDSLDGGCFDRLMGDERADLIFTDPPYNVKIDGNVCGLGAVRHREFAFASGEMDRAEFTGFLATALGCSAAYSRDGAIAFVCMDWRHVREVMDAGLLIFQELKNLCVWNKSNAGMGTFYRSKHELIFVFKLGTAPHTNNFGLGAKGRYRTNVWDYPGISSLSKTRSEELAMHPTVKPVQLVRDAIEDCSRRGEIVLDCFGGSGTTLIASERCGRSARLIELDPVYCDTIVRRFHQATGRWATLGESGPSFEACIERRSVAA